MFVGVYGNLIDFKALGMIFIVEVAQHHDASGAVFAGKDVEVEHDYLSGKIGQATNVTLVVGQCNVDDAAHFHLFGTETGPLLFSFDETGVFHALQGDIV